MNAAGSTFAVLAAAVHVYAFYLESVAWGAPKTNAVFGVSRGEAETLRLMAFNQGFYNLFLALGVLAGVVFGLPEVSAFALASMLGAAVVLAFSAQRGPRGPLVQGTFPALALLTLLLGRFA